MKRLLLFCMGGLMAAVGGAQAQPALRQGVSVKMVVTTNAAAVPEADEADSLVVAVTASGAVYLEVTKVTPAELTEKIRPMIVARAGRRVFVKGDARVSYAKVAEVLEAVWSAGASLQVLLTDQRDTSGVTPLPPKGLEVQVSRSAPDGARVLVVKAGIPLAEADLSRQARNGGVVVLRVTGEPAFGEVVRVVDECRGRGAKVVLERGE